MTNTGAGRRGGALRKWLCKEMLTCEIPFSYQVVKYERVYSPLHLITMYKAQGSERLSIHLNVLRAAADIVITLDEST